MRESSIDRTEVLLREALQGDSSTPPSARLFCRRHGISSRTYSAALARLTAAGTVAPRRGPRALWQEVARALEAEIRSGELPSRTALPSPKELSRRFRVHPVTIRRALGELTENGILVREGRRWSPTRLRSSSAVTAAPMVACIGMQMDGEREIDVWREVQSEAAAQGLTVRILPWEGELGEIPAGTIGAVVSTWHLADPQELLRQLVARRLRSCIWTESALDRATRDWQGERFLSFHDIGNSRTSGRDMARHLETLGHRHIAWLSPFHGSHWSKNRLEGLQQEFSGTVSPFVLGAVSEGDFMAPVAETLTRWEGSFEDIGPWHLSPMHPLWEAFKTQTWARLMEAFEPCLEGALATKATAWVGASDLVAALCRRWLLRHGLAVPQTLSLCGFDDTSLSLREDLTSYRFDTASMARAMIRSLLSDRPGEGRRTSHSGRVVARGSTAAPK